MVTCVRIVLAELSTWQRYGQACVVCRTVFDYTQRPIEVAWLGVRRTSPLHACGRHAIDPASVVVVT